MYPGRNLTILSVRLPRAQIAEADNLVAIANKKRRHDLMRRSDVLRNALAKGLVVLASELRAPKLKPPKNWTRSRK
jgi:hypothetical protein